MTTTNTNQNPEDILAVHALYSEPDDDDPNQVLVKEHDGRTVATIYVDSHSLSVRVYEDLPIAMVDLNQAYSWIVVKRLSKEQEKVYT
jgi:hypothetical protein